MSSISYQAKQKICMLQYCTVCVHVRLLLLPYSVKHQHYEDSDTFSAYWVILLFP